MTYGNGDYTTPHFTFEWNDTTSWVVISMTVLTMLVLIPLMIWCFGYCESRSRKMTIEEGEDELKNVERNHEISLEVFRQSHPQPVEEYDSIAASELSRINEDYQRRLSEITERRDAHIHRSKGKVQFLRIFSLYAYIVFWINLLYVILHSTTRIFGGSVFLILFVISVIVSVLAYLFVLRESISSSERKYIKNLSTNLFAVVHIEAILATQPSILFRAECYHYEEREIIFIHTGRHGHKHTSVEKFQEKVVSNIIVEAVNFECWKDTSASQLVPIKDKVRTITKIKMTLSVEPGDEETATAIFEQYSAFQNNHRHLDVFVDFSIKKDVRGFKKRLAAYTDYRGKPWWVSSALFMVATLLGFSWPYRWAFKSITCKAEFPVSKLVYIRRAAPE